MDLTTKGTEYPQILKSTIKIMDLFDLFFRIILDFLREVEATRRRRGRRCDALPTAPDHHFTPELI